MRLGVSDKIYYVKYTGGAWAIRGPIHLLATTSPSRVPYTSCLRSARPRRPQIRGMLRGNKVESLNLLMVASVTFPASEAARAELLFCISHEFLRLHGASATQADSVKAFLNSQSQGISRHGGVECVELEPSGTGLGLRLSPGESGTYLLFEGLQAKPLP